jgi:hypothetical protein
MKCEACGKDGTLDVGTYDLDVALGKEPLSVVRVLMLNGFRSRIRADERAKVLAMASAEPYRGIGRTGDCDCADDFTCAEHGGGHVLRDHK